MEQFNYRVEVFESFCAKERKEGESEVMHLGNLLGPLLAHA